jgi:hypothetical protein
MSEVCASAAVGGSTNRSRIAGTVRFVVLKSALLSCLGDKSAGPPDGEIIGSDGGPRRARGNVP